MDETLTMLAGVPAVIAERATSRLLVST